jgi:hypothetical protein
MVIYIGLPLTQAGGTMNIWTIRITAVLVLSVVFGGYALFTHDWRAALRSIAIVNIGYALGVLLTKALRR